MKRFLAWLLPAVLLFAPDARARDPLPDDAPAVDVAPPSPHGHFTAAILLGWGSLQDGLFDLQNELGFGYGARVGYTFVAHVYLGTVFVHHTGSSTEEALTAASLTYSGLEVGYDVGPLDHSFLRPYVGAGIGSQQGHQFGCDCGALLWPTPDYIRQMTLFPVWLGAQIHLISGPLVMALEPQLGWFFARGRSDTPIAPSLFWEVGAVFR